MTTQNVPEGMPERFNLYAVTESTLQWGEHTTIAVLDTEPDTDGEWVRFEAVEPLVAALQAEVAKFKQANGELTELNNARRRHLDNAKKALGIGPLDDLVGTIESLQAQLKKVKRERNKALRQRDKYKAQCSSI